MGQNLEPIFKKDSEIFSGKLSVLLSDLFYEDDIIDMSECLSKIKGNLSSLLKISSDP